MPQFIITYQPVPSENPNLDFLQRLQSEAEVPPRAAFIEAQDEIEALSKFVTHDMELGMKTGLISVVGKWEQWHESPK